jgi:hypothetical protein
VNPGYTYSYVRMSGWMPRPDFGAPSGTVALNLFWNATEGDNATLTDAAFNSVSHSGWTNVGQLGWVWTTPGANRIPLYAWFSSSRNDFFTTVFSNDYTSAGYTRVGAGFDAGAGSYAIGYILNEFQETQAIP